MRARVSPLLPLLLSGLLLPLIPGCSDDDADPCADRADPSCQAGPGDDAGAGANDAGDPDADANPDPDASDGAVEKPSTASATIGGEGGRIEVLGLTLEVPEGALQEDTLVTVTRTELAAPGSGYTPLYRFDPEGLVFDLPASVSFWLPPDFLSKPLTTFWSKRDEPSVYEDIGGEIGADAIVARTSHFSTGYVGLSEDDEPSGGCSPSGSFAWALENPLPTDVSFQSVAATSPNDMYAASHGAPDEARYWNGSSFARLNVPAKAVFAASPGHIFLATPTGVARGSGTSFVNEDLGIAFNAVHGSGPDNVWAVGEAGNVQRWNGSAWAAVDVGTDLALISVWVGSETNVWIGVAHSGTPQDITNTYAISFDGTSFRTWTKADFGLQAHATGPGSIWGSGPDDVYFCARAEYSLMRRFDGSDVTEIPNTALCSSVSGHSASEIYFAKSTGGLFGFDGSTVKELIANKHVTAVHASLPDALTIGGHGGTLGTYDGSHLEMHSSGFRSNLSSVWVSPTGEAYAQGPDGIFRGECGVWKELDSVGSHGGIHGLSASEVWIGVKGGVRRVTGPQFELGPVELFGNGDPDEYPRSLHVVAADNVFAAGWGAPTNWVRRWDGSAWLDITPSGYPYFGEQLLGLPTGEIFITGGDGLLQWQAGSWTSEATGVTGTQSLSVLPNGEIIVLSSSAPETSRIRGIDGIWRSAGLGTSLPALQFGKIWARTPTDIYGICGSNCQDGYLWHWDGSTWSQPARIGYLDSVHGNANGDVIAVGNQGRIWRRARR